MNEVNVVEDVERGMVSSRSSSSSQWGCAAVAGEDDGEQRPHRSQRSCWTVVSTVLYTLGQLTANQVLK